MTETGLIIAEVAFIVLLYALIFAIIRLSVRGLRRDDAGMQPLPQPGPEPVVDAPSPVVAAPVAAVAKHDPLPAAPALDDPPDPLDEPAGDTDSAPLMPPDAEEPEAAAEPPEPDVPSEAEDDLVAAPPLTDTGRRRALDLDSAINPRLVVEASQALEVGREIDLTGGVTIGRSRSSDLPVSDSFVSHTHARILRRGPYYFIEDLGSTNGTFLNEQRVNGDAQLRVRDVLRLGDTVLRYEE